MELFLYNLYKNLIAILTNILSVLQSANAADSFQGQQKGGAQVTHTPLNYVDNASKKSIR